MTSARKITTNRRNAARSTGPRTAQGKRRASRNAFKHGLAVSAARDPAYAAEIERLAKAFAGATTDPERLAVARAAAEAELDLRRAREYRTAVINTEIVAVRLEKAAQAGGDNEGDEPDDFTATMRVLDHWKTRERYERRAFSKRNRLFRALQGE